MSTILSLFASVFASSVGKAGAAALGVTVLGWILGKASRSAAYVKARDTAGRTAERGGEAVSALGKSRLGGLWNPLEEVATDFGAFMVEQFFVGLRKDNPRKMEEQLERLQGVGSETRAKALEEKLDALGVTPKPLQDANDAAMFLRAFEAGDQSINDRLGG